MNNPLISIIIPSYNEATYIPRLLDALARQSLQDFEIIVSDAQSKDETAEVVDEYARTMNVKLLQTPPKGPAVGRNVGAKIATGTWLLFFDADVDIDDQDFLKTLMVETQAKGWQTSSTDVRIRNASWSERLGLKLHHIYLRILAKTKHPVAPGFCILTRRDLFESLNGYDETLWVAEDYDYVSRTKSKGFGYVDSTYYYVDLRRFKEGGSIKVFAQSVGYEIYRFTHGFKIRKDPFNYQFGHHDERK